MIECSQKGGDLGAVLAERVALSNAAVRSLFSLRRAIGRALGWEGVRGYRDPPPIFRDRLTESLLRSVRAAWMREFADAVGP